jgi:hypothetical protein
LYTHQSYDKTVCELYEENKQLRTALKNNEFRGKRIDNGEWVEGQLLHSNFSTFIITMANTLNGKLFNLVHYEVDRETVEALHTQPTDTEVTEQ